MQTSDQCLTIRYATAADLPAIVEIYNTTVASRTVTADTTPVTVEDRRDWFDSHSLDRHPIWVTEHDTQVTGWLSLSVFYGRPAYRATAEVSVYVAATHRRRGIGRALMREAIAHAPSLQIHTLLGFVFAQNKPSMALLKVFGFEQWGFLPRVAEFETHHCDLVILGLSGLDGTAL